LDLKFLLSEKANAITDCLENQFTHPDLCDENHEWWVEAGVQALLEAVDNKPPERIRLYDLQTLINYLKMIEACRIYGIPNECLRHLPRRPLIPLTHLINNCFRLPHFPNPWKKVKHYRNPARTKIPSTFKCD
jgi:hypothetical protein